MEQLSFPICNCTTHGPGHTCMHLLGHWAMEGFPFGNQLCSDWPEAVSDVAATKPMRWNRAACQVPCTWEARWGEAEGRQLGSQAKSLATSLCSKVACGHFFHVALTHGFSIADIEASTDFKAGSFWSSPLCWLFVTKKNEPHLLAAR